MQGLGSTLAAGNNAFLNRILRMLSLDGAKFSISIGCTAEEMLGDGLEGFCEPSEYSCTHEFLLHLQGCLCLKINSFLFSCSCNSSTQPCILKVKESLSKRWEFSRLLEMLYTALPFLEAEDSSLRLLFRRFGISLFLCSLVHVSGLGWYFIINSFLFTLDI